VACPKLRGLSVADDANASRHELLAKKPSAPVVIQSRLDNIPLNGRAFNGL